MGKGSVGLADAIEALRNELIDAMNRGADKPMRFTLEPIELTVEVVVTKDAHGKIGWQVLEFGGSVEKERTQTYVARERRQEHRSGVGPLLHFAKEANSFS